LLEKLARLFTGPKARWITLAAWIVLTLVLTLTLPAVGDKVQNNAQNLLDDSPSVVAEKLVAEKFPSSSGVPALIVWHREGGLSAEDYALIQQLSQTLTGQPLQAQLPLIPLHEMPPQALQQFTSEDGTTLVQPIPFEDQTETEILKENLGEMMTIVKDASGTDPFAAAIDDSAELSVRITGPIGISVDATDLFLDADVTLLIATVLLVLILLLLIYRSPIMAFIPLVGVGFAYLVTSPLLGWMAGENWITVDSQAVSIMTVLLFGAGTDYCLFLISHYRQELSKEADKWSALKRAFKDASGAVAMSGFTVVLALFALLAAKYGAFHRFAVPFSLSIFIMGIASLTLVPALLAIIGRASFFPFVPRTEEMEKERAAKKGRTYNRPDPERKWGAKIGRLIIRKPWKVVIVCVVVLGGMAAFAPQIKYTYDLMSSFPEDMPSREGFTVIAEAFTPGDLAPVTIVAQTDGMEAGLKEKLASIPNVDHVGEPQASKDDPGLQSYSVTLGINPYSNEAMAMIPELRKAAERALNDANVQNASDKVWIAGQTAEQFDNEKLTNRDNSVIMPLVTVLIIILLIAYLRSFVASIYLIGTVLLSYTAALGIGWVILHYGMGFDAIQGAIPLYSFVFLIALGEDYNIFMISSIWKKRKQMPLKQAIKEGVAETGGVITSAGLILAATFAVLATLPIQVLVQFGLITAVGVLMDTFIVRPFLVPAITALLGKWAFWPVKHKEVAEKATVKQQ